MICSRGCGQQVKRLKRDIDRGEYPMDTHNNDWHAPTVVELVERYIDEHLPKLSAYSAKEIRQRGDAVPRGWPFLFPGDVLGQPVVNLKRFWERMRVQAEISDVRIHDLRHTFTSLLVSGGASLETIGRLLGHTQIGTTQRYAHLIDLPLRAGVTAVGQMLKPRTRVVGEGTRFVEVNPSVAQSFLL